jgi:hypothetical protein
MYSLAGVEGFGLAPSYSATTFVPEKIYRVLVVVLTESEFVGALPAVTVCAVRFP